jgi:hypothetical protein
MCQKKKRPMRTEEAIKSLFGCHSASRTQKFEFGKRKQGQRIPLAWELQRKES